MGNEHPRRRTGVRKSGVKRILRIALVFASAAVAYFPAMGAIGESDRIEGMKVAHANTSESRVGNNLGPRARTGSRNASAVLRR
jgi:hypothetical protein